MKTEAIKSMEQFAKKVITLSPEKQDEYFKSLEKTCLTTEDINTLKKCVTLFKMFTNDRFYKDMLNATMELYLSEI
jgi:hypothetical protein